VVASNSDGVLRSTLLGSGEANLAKEIIVMRDAPSAASAYNSGIDKTTGDILVFAHQDVFLPAGWSEALFKCIKRLAEMDPSWAVAGVYGVTESGKGVGHVYSTGLKRFVGESFTGPIQVSSIDEMIIILRRSTGLRFDEKLPGFHLYGTDICLEAEAHGMRSYVLPCFALHNSVGIKYLPFNFWQGYMYLRNKWKHRLPIKTPCTAITYGCIPIIDHLARFCWSSIRGKIKPGSRVADPERFYLEHLKWK
jgi:hypothetical protein